MPPDTVLDQITMSLWQAYEDEWTAHPTADDIAAAKVKYKPPMRVKYMDPKNRPKPPKLHAFAVAQKKVT
jgi:hypothetical protein